MNQPTNAPLLPGALVLHRSTQRKGHTWNHLKPVNGRTVVLFHGDEHYTLVSHNLLKVLGYHRTAPPALDPPTPTT